MVKVQKYPLAQAFTPRSETDGCHDSEAQSGGPEGKFDRLHIISDVRGYMRKRDSTLAKWLRIRAWQPAALGCVSIPVTVNLTMPWYYPKWLNCQTRLIPWQCCIAIHFTRILQTR
jgi:hypothetical protein